MKTFLAVFIFGLLIFVGPPIWGLIKIIMSFPNPKKPKTD